MKSLVVSLNPEHAIKRIPVAKTLGDRWCRLMHSSITWPLHGQYACATCGRLYPVPWANIHANERSLAHEN